MTQPTFGKRVPGSGQRCSPETMKLRIAIIDFVSKNPGTTSRPISKHLYDVGFENFNLFNSMEYLLDTGDIYGAREGARQYHYYFKGHVNMIHIPDTASEQFVHRRPQSQWPKLNLPVYSPIDWIVNQLQVK